MDNQCLINQTQNDQTILVGNYNFFLKHQEKRPQHRKTTLRESLFARNQSIKAAISEFNLWNISGALLEDR